MDRKIVLIFNVFKIKTIVVYFYLNNFTVEQQNRFVGYFRKSNTKSNIKNSLTRS